MNNIYKLAYCVILNFALNTNSLSQTYIGPHVGFDFQKVISARIFRLDLRNKGYGHLSPVIGLNLKQKLFDRLFLNVLSDFTHKHVRGFPDGSFSSDFLYHYNYIKNQFVLSYYYKAKWKIGGGLSYNLVNNLYFEDIEHEYISDQKFKYSENGYVFMLGLKYKNYEFEAYYYKRLHGPIVGDEIHFFHLHQIQSLGLRVSYDFKIFDACKKKDLPELQPGNKMAIVE